MKRRWPILLSVALIAGFAVAIPTVLRRLDREPMLDQLPPRYQTESVDIWRGPGGFTDFSMCMRVDLSPEEVTEFLPKFFDRSSIGVSVAPSQVETSCQAPFWPAQFETETIAFEEGYPPQLKWGPDSGSGAVYERGHLYFWSYSW